MTTDFRTVAIIGLGLIGSSIARATRERLPDIRLTGYDADENVRRRAHELGLADVADNPVAAVTDADLVILCVPVGAMSEAAASIADGLRPTTIVSDVGSAKAAVTRGAAGGAARRDDHFRPSVARDRE